MCTNKDTLSSYVFQPIGIYTQNIGWLWHKKIDVYSTESVKFGDNGLLADMNYTRSVIRFIYKKKKMSDLKITSILESLLSRL